MEEKLLVINCVGSTLAILEQTLVQPLGTQSLSHESLNLAPATLVKHLRNHTGNDSDTFIEMLRSSSHSSQTLSRPERPRCQSQHMDK
jgi:hypothetical protein